MSQSLYGAEVLRDVVDRVATDPETASLQEIRDVALAARSLLDRRILMERVRRIPYGHMCELVHDCAWAQH
ncbi:hypothetical protein [Nocardia pseudovaccinii]|uniref:hypothetical protein n=1 Tax=Nocardia pseudovaccinii TaxID=189540 RepID=UPI0007A3D2CA|nr:hypothetical protein [Nocardia pseudovaccinii]